VRGVGMRSAESECVRAGDYARFVKRVHSLSES